MEDPFICNIGQFYDPFSVMMGSSPRFGMYGNEFGMGKAVAILSGYANKIRSGYANKFDGKVTSYSGYEGGFSMDLEVCFSPEAMRGIESDDEFMEAVCG